ncbi:MAG TPA: hypothetical protein VGM06_04080 [Polyangiaceae bacterium]
MSPEVVCVRSLDEEDEAPEVAEAEALAPVARWLWWACRTWGWA